MADLGASPFVISATGTYSIPANVTYLTVEAWGGGSRGYLAAGYASGAGGGAGGYAKRNIMRVVPGNSYTFTVGVGGTGHATPGTSSEFTDADGYQVLAYYGNGATGANLLSCLGDIRYSGGNGGNGQNSNGSIGGGGGESGGPNGSGSNGSDSINGGAGGTGHADAGDGGAGGVAEIGAVGSPGVIPGGGGGGAASCANTYPGNGANGQIRVTYHTTATSPVILFSTQSWTVPAGVTAIKVECYSGGGSGAAGNDSNAGGGGGAGGYAVRTAMRVIPLKTYTFTVAAGCAGQTGSAGFKTGLNGGYSYFTGEDAVICQARQGTGGTSTAKGTCVGTPYGDTKYNGGTGGEFYVGGGGGGGGEGGGPPSGVGHNGGDGGFGAGGAGGTGGDGGDGGAGGTLGSNGSAGTAPGGGGGAGGSFNGTYYGNSGGGARGQTVITYTQNLSTKAFNGGVANDRNMAF